MNVKKENCCGCCACKNVCPTKAILMLPDKDGFLYPQINSDICIDCGLCTSVCSYRNATELRTPQAVYAATCLDTEILHKSSSGGMFAVLAKAVLADGGKIYGAVYIDDEEQGLHVSHVGIDSDDQLWRMQGSKYVQSDIGLTYQEAEQDLKSGRKVLFSGTPCQIDGLKGYLKKDYDNLLTVDVICHGVPSNKQFAEYIRFLEGKYRGKVKKIEFRDKTKGWEDFFVRTEVQRKHRTVTKTEHWNLSAYYVHFLKADMYRLNCYSCKYAVDRRCSDITLGDYWGIRNEHSELFADDRWWNRLYSGISCVLINSDRGRKMLETVQNQVDCIGSTLEKASRYNAQLQTPAHHNGRREALLERWREGYVHVEEDLREKMGWRYYLRKVIDLIRPEWKHAAKKAIRTVKRK